ncbi:unnamed protein product [Clonostachys solani]|uniref:Uncharacterized protein n=1 Tax=Clonostachys solani TaxID=160281 RepID=A0A9N9ZCD2_9HYPO|nr:unnamed protein product [Clonostachys solani]
MENAAGDIATLTILTEAKVRVSRRRAGDDRPIIVTTGRIFPKSQSRNRHSKPHADGIAASQLIVLVALAVANEALKSRRPMRSERQNDEQGTWKEKRANYRVLETAKAKSMIIEKSHAPETETDQNDPPRSRDGKTREMGQNDPPRSRDGKTREMEQNNPPRSRDGKSKEQESVRFKEPKPEEGERRHRRSRRHSHASHTSRPEPAKEPPVSDRDIEKEEEVLPEKKFFGMKNAQGVLRSSSSTPPTREQVAAPEPSPEEPPLDETPKKHRSSRHRHSSSRQPPEEPRPRSSRKQEAPSEERGKSSRGPPEDAARKARSYERRKAREEEKKPTGIKAAFKKLFSSS